MLVALEAFDLVVTTAVVGFREYMSRRLIFDPETADLLIKEALRIIDRIRELQLFVKMITGSHGGLSIEWHLHQDNHGLYLLYAAC